MIGSVGHVTINAPPDVNNTRAWLLQYLWGGVLPTFTPSAIERDFDISPVPTGTAQIDRFTTTNLGGRGGSAYAYWVTPTVAENGRIIVWHNGHAVGWNTYAPSVNLISTALVAGYCVLCLEMPLYGHQPGGELNPDTTLDLTVNGETRSFVHNEGGNLHPFDDMDIDGGTPSGRIFHDPIQSAVNQVLIERPTYSLYAIGHSGGGDLIGVAAAYDRRYAARYSIFSDLEWSIADANPVYDREREKSYPVNFWGGDFVRRYAAATIPAPRRAIQIVADYDSEFPVLGKHDLVSAVQSKARALAGNDRFSYWYTDETDHHFNQTTIDRIFADIATG